MAINVASKAYASPLTPRDMDDLSIRFQPVVCASFWQFAGTFDREHGVVGGIVTFNPEDIVGVTNAYLGLIQDNIDGEGFVHARRDFRRDDIPSTNAGAIRVEGRPINRFIALDFGTMAPDESKTLRYQRIMTVLPEGERSEDGIQRWVSSVVARIQGG